MSAPGRVELNLGTGQYRDVATRWRAESIVAGLNVKRRQQRYILLIKLNYVYVFI